MPAADVNYPHSRSNNKITKHPAFKKGKIIHDHHKLSHEDTGQNIKKHRRNTRIDLFQLKHFQVKPKRQTRGNDSTADSNHILKHNI